MAEPNGSKNRKRLVGFLLSTAGIAIPALSLIPLGSLWLWQNGYLLHWAIGASAVVMAVVGVQWLVLKRAGAVPDVVTGPEPNGRWNEREKLAWAAVTQYAETLNPETVSGEQAISDLAVRTIETVARHMHPGDPHPLWNFTVPEALTLAERVASRLRPILVDNVPLGDQLTVRQMMKLYEWRVAGNWAERAYDIWRIVRLLNPATALANEARERVTRRLYTGLRDEFVMRIARAYVFEVARAAIDLYSGRLRVEPSEKLVPAANLETGDTLTTAPRSFRWSRVARQAANAGRSAARSIISRKSPPAE